MSTVIVEQNVYNNAVNYARKHNTSVDKLVEAFLRQLSVHSVPSVPADL